VVNVRLRLRSLNGALEELFFGKPAADRVGLKPAVLTVMFMRDPP